MDDIPRAMDNYGSAMESSWPSGIQGLTILTLGQKFVVVGHQLLQHDWQAKEHSKIIRARKQKPAHLSLGNLQKRTQNTNDKNQKKTRTLNFNFQCYG